MHSDRTKGLVAAALIAALIAVGALVSLPIGPIPITLQLFAVVLAALVLPPGQAFFAVAIYVLVGAVGVPVFAGAKGGLGVLMGPTAGFILGFLVSVPLAALVRRTLSERLHRVAPAAADAVAAAIVVGIVYLLGWAHLAFVTGIGAAAAFLGGVVPFVVPDALKAAAAVVVAGPVRRSRMLGEV